MYINFIEEGFGPTVGSYRRLHGALKVSWSVCVRGVVSECRYKSYLL